MATASVMLLCLTLPDAAIAWRSPSKNERAANAWAAQGSPRARVPSSILRFPTKTEKDELLHYFDTSGLRHHVRLTGMCVDRAHLTYALLSIFYPEAGGEGVALKRISASHWKYLWSGSGGVLHGTVGEMLNASASRPPCSHEVQ